MNDVAEDGAYDESQADSYGKSDGETGDIDGGDEEEVGDVEDDAAADGVGDCVRGRVCQRCEEGDSRVAKRAESEAPGERAEDYAECVVPVEELESVIGAELEGVGPRSSAEHAEDHEGEGDLVCLGQKHCDCP